MTKDNLVTVPVGTTLQEARAILQKHRIEKLLVVDGQGHLRGLITVKDIEKSIEYPNACKDSLGRLRVGAAVGVGKDLLERAAALVEAKVDVLCLDSSHGHSQGVLDAVKALKQAYPAVSLIAGNVATYKGAKDLCERRRRRREDRHRARLHLHHPHRHRRGHAPDHRRGRGQPGLPRRPACPASPTAASSSAATWPRPSPRAPTP